VLPFKSEKEIKEAAKTVFLEEYDKLLESDPQLEEKVFKVKGLMSELLKHKKRKAKMPKRRRNSICNDDSTRKKVRFNISSTIYEDASANQDESMSIIEPLSIFSTVSPPQERADVSFPQLQMPLNRLNSLTSQGVQLLDS
jgi:hypothetical protein